MNNHMIDQERLRTTFRPPYSYWLVGIFVAYMTLSIVLSQFYLSILYIPYYLGQIHWLEVGISAVLAVFIGFLVALTSVLSYIQFKHHKRSNAQTTVSCVAGLGGLTTGICPVCVSGFFPLVMNWFGLSFSWALLPFKGIEIQLLIVVMLLGSFYWVVKK